MGYVDKATQALLGSDLLVNIGILDGSKIADITHADTAEHTLTPEALGLPPNAIGVFADFRRIAGTGSFQIYTDAGGDAFTVPNADEAFWPISLDGTFRYAMSVISDDWDIYGFAVIVRGRLEG